MARRIPLKVVMIEVNGDGQTAPFVWGELMQHIIKHAHPQRGIVMDEVLRCLDALKPIEAAMAKGDEYVTFNEDQFRLLKQKLEEFPFAVAAPEIADFGMTIRDAQEIT